MRFWKALIAIIVATLLTGQIPDYFPHHTSVVAAYPLIRIAAGQTVNYTDTSGNVWLADVDFTSGTADASLNGTAVSGTNDSTLYDGQRYGASFTYSIPAPAGTYNVTLKFTENYVAAASLRQFNVALNGTQVLFNFDIYAASGGQFEAVDRSFQILLASPGTISIAFTSGAAQTPKVDAILVTSNKPIGALYNAGTIAVTPTPPVVGTQLIGSPGSSTLFSYCGTCNYTYSWTRNSVSPVVVATTANYTPVTADNTGCAGGCTLTYTVTAIPSSGGAQASGQVTTVQVTPTGSGGSGNDTSGGLTGVAGAYLLPAGRLATNGNQIVSQATGNTVRLACVGMNDFTGTQGFSPAQAVAGVKAAGFNCIRYPYYDQTIAADMACVDSMIAQNTGIKFILDHHGNEAVLGASGGGGCFNTCGATNSLNGLWYDQGGGGGNWSYSLACPWGNVAGPGNWTDAAVLTNWQTLANHFKGNNSVIGYDLHNEPHNYLLAWNPGGGGPSWGTAWGVNGTVTLPSSVDIHDYYQRAGNAILAIDPNVLIIAEAPISSGTTNYYDGTSGFTGTQPDCSLCVSNPVVLNVAHRVVYSVHQYPATIGGGAPSITQMNKLFGNAAGPYPMFMGETGGSLDGLFESSGTSFNRYTCNFNGATNCLQDEQNFFTMLTAYMNGQDGSSGGPTFAANCAYPMHVDWWNWGNFPYASGPDGINAGNNPNAFKAGQAAVYANYRFTSNCTGGSGVPVNTTLPSITGIPQPGNTLTEVNGQWSKSPTSRKYQWYFSGVLISGATNQTYPIPSWGADLGATITVTEIATNGSGDSLPATSAGVVVRRQ